MEKSVVAALLLDPSQIASVEEIVAVPDFRDPRLGLIFSVGGFKVVHPRIHSSLGIGLLWIGVGAGFVRPNAMAIVEAAEKGEDLGALAGRAKKVAAGTGIGHLLFLVMLTLMLWRM